MSSVNNGTSRMRAGEWVSTSWLGIGIGRVTRRVRGVSVYIRGWGRECRRHGGIHSNRFPSSRIGRIGSAAQMRKKQVKGGSGSSADGVHAPAWNCSLTQRECPRSLAHSSKQHRIDGPASVYKRRALVLGAHA